MGNPVKIYDLINESCPFEQDTDTGFYTNSDHKLKFCYKGHSVERAPFEYQFLYKQLLEQLKRQRNFNDEVYSQWMYYIGNEATYDIERIAQAIMNDEDVFFRGVYQEPCEFITMHVGPLKDEDKVTIHLKEDNEN